MTDIEKTLAELSDEEVRDEGLRLAKRYLKRRGFDVIDEDWSCTKGDVDIISIDCDVTVLVNVMTEADPGGDPSALPDLKIDGEQTDHCRGLMLRYLEDHSDVETARFDLVSIRLLSDHNAKLRHLVGLFSWNE